VLLKKITLIVILLISITNINADTFDIRPYNIFSEQNLKTTNKKEELKTGLALDIKVNNTSKINYTLAYEGDYMFINNYLEDEKQIKNNNFYIGIGYKF